MGILMEYQLKVRASFSFSLGVVILPFGSACMKIIMARKKKCVQGSPLFLE